jgi:hypothetical protein
VIQVLFLDVPFRPFRGARTFVGNVNIRFFPARIPMKLNRISKALACSLVIAMVALAGCEAPPAALNPAAVDTAKKALAEQDATIAKSAKGKSGKYKGPLPKISRGRIDIQGQSPDVKP